MYSWTKMVDCLRQIFELLDINLLEPIHVLGYIKSSINISQSNWVTIISKNIVVPIIYVCDQLDLHKK